MGHKFPNMIGVDASGIDEKIQELLPGYMTMGVTGIKPLQSMHMPVPENAIPMLGYTGQFGQTVMGGMATVFKARKQTSGYKDPGPYHFPPDSVAKKATPEQMARDGIVPPETGSEAKNEAFFKARGTLRPPHEVPHRPKRASRTYEAQATDS